MTLTYEEFEKALETLEIVSKASILDIKNKYQKLSKQYHPDMLDGDNEKFLEVNEAYKTVSFYMKNFRFQLNEEEFHQQNPHARLSEDWFYSFNN